MNFHPIKLKFKSKTIPNTHIANTDPKNTEANRETHAKQIDTSLYTLNVFKLNFKIF